jgi:hypothetical protein
VTFGKSRQKASSGPAAVKKYGSSALDTENAQFRANFGPRKKT